MKKRNLVIALAVTAITFAACKKMKDTAAADATTTSIVSQSSTSDNLTEDANNVFTQTVNDTTVLGAARPAPFYNATITITPAIGFPKTVTIDFGTGTTSMDGIIRSGKIIAVVSDSFRLSGTTDSLTFVNYVVNGYQLTGSIVWDNTSVGDTLSWIRLDSGTITEPVAFGGKYWHHLGQRDVIQTAGFADNNLFDNVYAITGSHTYSNSDGINSSSTIILPLEKKADCFFIDQGQILVTGPINSALIDFGDGTCDNKATFSINGGPSYGFTF
jgi:hypothetical protein